MPEPISDTPYDWMPEARQAAAQCWCNEETSGIEMDVRLAEAVARLVAAWMQTGAQHARNESYWRDRAETAERERAAALKAIAESCDEQRGEYWPCERAAKAEAALAAALADAEPVAWVDRCDLRELAARRIVDATLYTFRQETIVEGEGVCLYDQVPLYAARKQ